MATASEKRKAIVELARRFTGNNAIMEDVSSKQMENRGRQLEEFLSIHKGWRPGLAWCAAYISALSLYIDRDLGNSPPSRYVTNDSQFNGAGIFSKDVNDAYPGLVISWKNEIDNSGHVGLIIDVDVKKGIVYVSEGDTGSYKESNQTREGYTTSLKTYTFEKLYNPKRPTPKSPYNRYFRAYIKIWDESNESIRNTDTSRPMLMADLKEKQSQNENFKSGNYFASNDLKQERKKQIQTDYSKLFLFSNGEILDYSEDKEIKTSINQKNKKEKIATDEIPLDKQSITV